MRNLAVGFAVGAVVGGAAMAYVFIRSPDTVMVSTGRKAAAKAVKHHPALKYGAPSSGYGSQHLTFYDGFVTAFDTRTRNPCWVLEQLDWKDKYADGVDRSKSEFYEDENIDEKFRNHLSDFKGSGYDRGHLAPAANHKHSQKAMDETFTMSNVSPQVGRGFNRDYWARFEKFVKDLMKTSTSVFVVTGPLWLPKRDKDAKKWTMQYPLIGEAPRLVSVPTHFYKVILAENKDGGAATGVAAFVMPNEEINPNTPLTRFSAPIGDLECATGMKFFPNYLTDDRKAVLDDAAVEWREYGKAKDIQGKKSNPQLPGDTSSPQSVEMAHQTSLSEKAAARGLPKTRFGGKGAVHLCENTGCEVAAREFWTKKK